MLQNIVHVSASGNYQWFKELRYICELVKMIFLIVVYL